MPERPFKVEIVTPERVMITRDDVVSLVVPGAEGSLGILAGHAPILAELSVGVIWMRSADGAVTRLAASGGFMEVKRNVARILADTAELAEEIDIARAQEAVRRAEERLHEQKTDIDMARAQAALNRAMNRLRVARGE